MDSYEADLTIDDVTRFIKRLERFADKFEETGDFENSRMMDLCTALMVKLQFDLQTQSENPFLMKLANA